MHLAELLGRPVGTLGRCQSRERKFLERSPVRGPQTGWTWSGLFQGNSKASCPGTQTLHVCGPFPAEGAGIRPREPVTRSQLPKAPTLPTHTPGPPGLFIASHPKHKLCFAAFQGFAQGTTDFHMCQACLGVGCKNLSRAPQHANMNRGRQRHTPSAKESRRGSSDPPRAGAPPPICGWVYFQSCILWAANMPNVLYPGSWPPSATL